MRIWSNEDTGTIEYDDFLAMVTAVFFYLHQAMDFTVRVPSQLTSATYSLRSSTIAGKMITEREEVFGNHLGYSIARCQTGRIFLVHVTEKNILA